MIKLRKMLPEDRDNAILEQINDKSFPHAEHLSLNDMYLFANKYDIDVLGIFNDGVPVGFMCVMKHKHCCYGLYFAIEAALRNKGLGKQALNLYFDYYREYQCVVDIDMTAESPEINDINQRRKAFYLRNGFYRTGYHLYYCNMDHEVLCYSPNFDLNGFRELVEKICNDANGFHMHLYKYLPSLSPDRENSGKLSL